MKSERDNWHQLSGLLEHLIKRHAEAWGSDAVGGLPTPDHSVEQELDQLCAGLVANPRQILFPRAELRPWLLARLLGAQALAAKSAEHISPPPVKSPPEALTQLLIQDWHNEVKPRWWRIDQG